MPQGPMNINVAKKTDGYYAPIPLGVNNTLVVNALNGRKYNQAAAGSLFFGANQSFVTLSAALATTYVGLCLTNPAGSGKDLILRQVSAAIIIAPANFLAFGLMFGTGTVTHTTPVTPRAARIGGAAGVGLLDAAATIPTPVWARWLANNLATGGSPQFNGDMEGSILIPPGSFVAIGGNAAGPASGFAGSLEWEEVTAAA